MCTGGPSSTLRHNDLRSVLAKAIKKAVYDVKYEYGGRLNDYRKPGNIIAYTGKGKKHIIDVAITNPLAATYRKRVLSGGPEHTAKFIEESERAKFLDLNKD